MINNLEVVYYSEPVTSTLKSLALLGLVYDKVYFPGVFIPSKGVDEKEATEIVKNFRLSEQKDYNQILTIRCIQFAINYKFIKDFCVFTGKYGYLGTLEDGAGEIADDLEKLIFGEPPENFYPTYASGLSISYPAIMKHPLISRVG